MTGRSMFDYQSRVIDWLIHCFGLEIARDKKERRQRFLEEALELCQAAGASKEEVLALVEYVYSRPVGELPQEIGGVAVCFASFCQAHGESMEMCAETELARVWTKIDKIRAKHALKPNEIKSVLV